MNKKSNQLYPNYFTFPAIALFGIFFVFPVLATFFFSFTDWNINRLFEPRFNGLDNFVYLLDDPYFKLALKNTFTFGIITTLLIVVIGLVLALLLNQTLKGEKFLRTIFYLPAVLSLIVIGIIFKAVYKMNGGILNQLLDLLGLSCLKKDWLGNPDTALAAVIFVQVWKWSGYAMTIFLAGLQGIGKEYYEAAIIDGANKWQCFKNITFPLLATAFTVVVTMNAIGGFKVFEQVYVLTNGGPGNATQVLGTYIYKEFAKGSLGRSSAMGLILFILIACMSLILNNLLRRREICL